MCVEFLANVCSSAATSMVVPVSDASFHLAFAFDEMIPFVYLEWCCSTKWHSQCFKIFVIVTLIGLHPMLPAAILTSLLP